MGFLGLIVSLVGASVLARDKIQDDLFRMNNAAEARKKGKKTYYGLYGGEYSLKTGNSVLTHYAKNRTYKIDSKTHKVVEDVTETRNKRREERNRLNAKKEGRAFYCTTKWDTDSNKCIIYVRDDMPGHYFTTVVGDDDDASQIYVEGNIIKDIYTIEENAKTVEPYYPYTESYYADGVKRTPEEIARRAEERYKIQANFSHKRFYKSYNKKYCVYKSFDMDGFYIIDDYGRYYKAKQDGDKFVIADDKIWWDSQGVEYKPKRRD